MAHKKKNIHLTNAATLIPPILPKQHTLVFVLLVLDIVLVVTPHKVLHTLAQARLTAVQRAGAGGNRGCDESATLGAP